jgi:hypothetical protein
VRAGENGADDKTGAAGAHRSCATTIRIASRWRF